MIGNDIVDLNEASKSRHWSDQRFINKVFSASERELIVHSPNRFHITWMLWSMKESAYKVHLRKFRKPFFAPSKIECQFEADGSGKIRIDKATYKAKTLVNKDFIYTVVMTDPSREYFGEYQKFVDSTYTNLHKKCYQDLIKLSALLLNEQAHTMEIKKDEYGIPKLFKNNSANSLIFSITHHGKYYAYVILK